MRHPITYLAAVALTGLAVTATRSASAAEPHARPAIAVASYYGAIDENRQTAKNAASRAISPWFTLGQARNAVARTDRPFWHRVGVAVHVSGCWWHGQRAVCVVHLRGVFFTVNGRNVVSTVSFPQPVWYRDGRLTSPIVA